MRWGGGGIQGWGRGEPRYKGKEKAIRGRKSPATPRHCARGKQALHNFPFTRWGWGSPRFGVGGMGGGKIRGKKREQCGEKREGENHHDNEQTLKKIPLQGGRERWREKK